MMNNQTLHKLLIPFSSLLVLLVFASVNYSQIGIGCVNDDHDTSGHLPKGKTIYYTFVGITGTQKTQIETAFSTWQTNNTTPSNNCSAVSFAPGTAPSGGVTITISNKALNNVASSYHSSYNLTTFEISSAEIFFDLNFKISIGANLVNYYDLSKDGYDTIFTKMALHEIGHLMGLSHYTTGHPDSCQGITPDTSDDQKYASSVMNDGCNPNDVNGNIPTSPTYCDNDRIKITYPCPTPTPTPSPTPTPNACPYPANNFQYPENQGCPANRVNNGFGCCIIRSGTCNGEPDYTQYPSTGCASGFVVSGGTCTRTSAFVSNCDKFGGYDTDACGCFGDCAFGSSCSPVLIDVIGNGFSLTDALNGVNFDVDGNGSPERRAWTAASSDDSWLVLDHDGNGTIDGGKEMFGSVMSQPPPPEGVEFNGFNALAQFDEPGFGGNDDGQIDSQDAIFNQLQLWQDTNHNGISEANELHTLPELGLRIIDLKYKASRRTDQYGNQFKYRSKVTDANGAQLGRWAWDVFLVK